MLRLNRPHPLRSLLCAAALCAAHSAAMPLVAAEQRPAQLPVPLSAPVKAPSAPQAPAASSAPQRLQCDAATGALSLSLPGGAGRVALSTPGFTGPLLLRADQPLRELDLGNGASVVWFGVEDGRGSVRSVAALLQRRASGVSVIREWIADCAPVGETGFKREKQSFALAPGGELKREALKKKVEGHFFKLDCGCEACQSSTFEYTERETWAWDPAAGAFVQRLQERAYILQYGENLMAVARKALGDARMLARLYRLNPQLKPGETLKEGAQVVFERIEK